jgi:alkanesulfonate monooxygenase SsuD/methylene tetrahydromethanopterin reductase-like flavin-dependent oxidoreductase (luciferase family)
MTAPALRFGMLTMQHPPWSGLLDRWRTYEALGFDSVWLCDHFIGQRGEPLFEAWTLLAALAARTRRIRLGTVVTCNAFRHPALLAKEAITVDHISGGRLELGLGAGWWEAESPMFGISFPPPAERVDRFLEAVEVLGRLLSPGDGPVTYPGHHYQIDHAMMRPAPIQRPRPPLMLAGQGPRMLHIVARHADTWVASFGLRPEEMATRNRFLDARCRALGRDPASLRRAFVWAPWVHAVDPWDSPAAFVEFVDRYHAAGVTEFILDEPRTEQQPVLQRIARDVVPILRAR